MCFSSKPKPAPTPAPAPPPPEPPPEQQDIGSTRRASDIANYGSDQPDLRIRDNSVGVGSGGTGLRM